MSHYSTGKIVAQASSFVRFMVLLLSLSPLVVVFQNCGSPFEVSSNFGNLSSSSQAVCVNGQTQTGYTRTLASLPNLCGNQITKTCIGGQWDNNVVLYPSCIQQCLRADNQQLVDAGSTYDSFSITTAATQAMCDAARVTSTCQQDTGLFMPAPGSSTCLVSGQVCAYTVSAGLATPTGNMVGSTVSGYVSNMQTYPQLCGAAQTRTCQANGSWSGTTPLYQNCTQRCLHPQTQVPVNENTAYNYTYYTIATGTQAQCDQSRVSLASSCSRDTGQFSPQPPANTFATCNVVLPPTISSFTASPSTIMLENAATLTWVASAGSTLRLDPGAINVTGVSSYRVTPITTTSYTLTATNIAGVATAPVTVTVTPMDGKVLYANRCSSCHGTLDVSTKRNATVASINSAILNISSMTSLVDLSQKQVQAISTALSTTTTEPPTGTSSFTCTSAAAEKYSSRRLTRLTGTELSNTYKSVLPAAVWSALANYYYLIPTDGFDGKIETFAGDFNADTFEPITRFNDFAATALTSSTANIQAFIGNTCATTTSFTRTCFDTFMASKGSRILRTAVSTEDINTYWTAITASASNATDQIKVLSQMLFNDPRFQFHIEVGDGTATTADGLVTLNSYEVANRISYGLISSPPDDSLWTAAQSNQLKTLANVTSHVDRITQLAAYKNRIYDFFKFYTGQSNVSNVSSNSVFLQGQSTAGYTTAVEQDLKEYINHIVFTSNGTLRDLLTSTAVFPTTSSLAQTYGSGVWSTGASPQSAVNHPGLLTRAYFNLSNTENIPYIMRAKKLRGNLLCSPVAPPTIDTIAQRPTLTEQDLITLSRRAYIDKATLSSSICVGCHSQMNQLSYLSGNYDTFGRYVLNERVFNPTGTLVAERQVVTAGVPSITPGDSRSFTSFRDLQVELSVNDSFQRCFTRKAVQYFNHKLEDQVIDGCTLKQLDTSLKTSQPLKNFFSDKFKSQSILYKKIN